MNSSIPPDSELSAAEFEARSEADLLRNYDILRLRAPNPGPLTLSGTNTWVVGRRPAWVVDPGPLIDSHVERLLAAIDARGGLGGVALTHDHRDHSEAVETLLEQHPAPLAAGRGRVDVRLAEDARFGPFQAVSTPGTPPTTSRWWPTAPASPATPCSATAASSSRLTRARCPATCSPLTRLRLREDFNVLCPGHGRRCGMRTPSSRSTSPIASTAKTA